MDRDAWAAHHAHPLERRDEKARTLLRRTVYTSLFIGDNNWPAIRAAMKKINYDGWLIAEMEARYKYAQDQQFYDTAADIDRLIAGTSVMTQIDRRARAPR